MAALQGLLIISAIMKQARAGREARKVKALLTVKITDIRRQARRSRKSFTMKAAILWRRHMATLINRSGDSRNGTARPHKRQLKVKLSLKTRSRIGAKTRARIRAKLTVRKPLVIAMSRKVQVTGFTSSNMTRNIKAAPRNIRKINMGNRLKGRLGLNPNQAGATDWGLINGKRFSAAARQAASRVLIMLMAKAVRA